MNTDEARAGTDPDHDTPEDGSGDLRLIGLWAIAALGNLDDDAALEMRILVAQRLCLTAQDEAEQRAAWNLMCELVRQRSPRQIERMERESGLG